MIFQYLAIAVDIAIQTAYFIGYSTAIGECRPLSMTLITLFYALPVIYVVLGAYNVITRKTIRFYIVCLFPVLLLPLIAVLYEIQKFVSKGTTEYISNPDSSLFLWSLYYSIPRIIVYFAGLIGISLKYWISRDHG